MPRRTLLVVLGGLGVVLATLPVVSQPPTVPPRVSQANFSKIRGGMSLAEVKAILGGPPTRDDIVCRRNKWLEEQEFQRRSGVVLTMRARLAEAEWIDGDARALVLFDPVTLRVLKNPPRGSFRGGPGVSGGFLDNAKRIWDGGFPE
jgi:hypothetical protein